MKIIFYLCCVLVITSCFRAKNIYGGFSEISYKDNVPNGIAYHYDSLGTLRKEEYYLNGMLEGRVLEYHSNSKVAVESYFSKGRLNGLVKVYDKNDKLITVSIFKDGILNGNSINFLNNYFPKHIIRMENGYNIQQTLFDTTKQFIKSISAVGYANQGQQRGIIYFNSSQLIKLEKSLYISTEYCADTVAYGKSYECILNLHVGAEHLKQVPPLKRDGSIICMLTNINESRYFLKDTGMGYKYKLSIPAKKKGLNRISVFLGYESHIMTEEGLYGVENEISFYVK